MRKFAAMSSRVQALGPGEERGGHGGAIARRAGGDPGDDLAAPPERPAQVDRGGAGLGQQSSGALDGRRRGLGGRGALRVPAPARTPRRRRSPARRAPPAGGSRRRPPPRCVQRSHSSACGQPGLIEQLERAVAPADRARRSPAASPRDLTPPRSALRPRPDFRRLAAQGIRERRPEEARLLDPRHPRRAAARPDDRLGDGADLRHLDLRPRGAGQAQGLRVRARPEPHPRAPSRRTWRRSKAGLAGHAFASGMAAISTLMTLVKAGEHVVLSRNVYGGTFRFMTQVLSRYGVESPGWTPPTSPTPSAPATERTRMVYLETPTNPMMEVTDIAGAAAPARTSTARSLAVDNTFLSPYLQRPLEHGADVVVHSTTKFLNGHSDSIGGVLIATRARPRRVVRLRPEIGRRHPVALRLVPGDARHQDARRAHGAPRSERPRHRRAPGGAPQGQERALPGPARAIRGTSSRSARRRASAR